MVGAEVGGRWPKNFKTTPELEECTRYGVRRDFEAVTARLIGSGWRGVAARNLENARSHPIFGPMRPKDWLRWGYLHADHHLRQFGR